MYAVILAGGGGTRLWPLSRPERPKPFLPLIGDRTLLQRTWDRIVPDLVDAGDVAVVTDRRYVGIVREQLPGLREDMLLAEPVGRNTAAAVALAGTAIDRPDDDVMLVLPADHLVGDEPGFRAILRRAATLAGRSAPDGGPGRLVTLGIAPDGPETGYGYIVAGEAIPGDEGAVVVSRFVEKPSAEAARAMLAGPTPVAWNAGIFLWRRDALHAAFEAGSPDILADVETGVAGGAGGARGGVRARPGHVHRLRRARAGRRGRARRDAARRRRVERPRQLERVARRPGGGAAARARTSRKASWAADREATSAPSARSSSPRIGRSSPSGCATSSSSTPVT